MSIQTPFEESIPKVKEIYPGDIFVIYPNESSKPLFCEDCTLVVVKIPSIPRDKIVDE